MRSKEIQKQMRKKIFGMYQSRKSYKAISKAPFTLQATLMAIPLIYMESCQFAATNATAAVGNWMGRVQRRDKVQNP